MPVTNPDRNPSCRACRRFRLSAPGGAARTGLRRRRRFSNGPPQSRPQPPEPANRIYRAFPYQGLHRYFLSCIHLLRENATAKLWQRPGFVRSMPLLQSYSPYFSIFASRVGRDSPSMRAVRERLPECSARASRIMAAAISSIRPSKRVAPGFRRNTRET